MVQTAATCLCLLEGWIESIFLGNFPVKQLILYSAEDVVPFNRWKKNNNNDCLAPPLKHQKYSWGNDENGLQIDFVFIIRSNNASKVWLHCHIMLPFALILMNTEYGWLIFRPLHYCIKQSSYTIRVHLFMIKPGKMFAEKTSRSRYPSLIIQ